MVLSGLMCEGVFSKLADIPTRGMVVGMAATGAAGPEQDAYREGVQQAGRLGGESSAGGMASVGASGPERDDEREGVQQAGRLGGESAEANMEGTDKEGPEQPDVGKGVQQAGREGKDGGAERIVEGHLESIVRPSFR